jgi:hypothetical protein
MKKALILFLCLILSLAIGENAIGATNSEPWEYTIGHEIRSVAISHDGQNVVVGTSYPYASIYYFSNEKLFWKYDISGGSVYGLDISADGKYIVAVGDKVIFMTRDKRVLWNHDITTTITSVEITPNAEYTAVGAYDGVYLFSKNGKLFWHYPFDLFKTRSVYVAITPDGRYIAATALIEHDGGYVYLFSKDGNLLWEKKVSDSFVLSVDISDDGKYLAVGLDREWLLLNKNGDILYRNNVIGGRAIAISSDNKYIAVRDTRRVYIFDIKGSKVAGIELSTSEETGIGSPTKLMDITPDFNSLVIGIMHGVNKIKVYPTIFGYVQVTSIPENATLYLNDKYQGKVPQTLKLFPGTYKLELRKAGYFPYTESITVSPGSNLSITAQLTPVAHLNIYSTPSEAYVYLNGTLIGKTPIEYYKVPPGSYEVRISKEGYQDYRTILTIGGKESKTANANLVLLNGTLKIFSEPVGGEVYINGSYKGTTPLTLELYPGDYTVEIKKEGYEPYTEKTRVLPGRITSVTATLSLLNGALTIFSEPSGAEVYLNGTLIGSTPIQNYKITPGKYKLEITKENYESNIIEVIVNPGESKNVSVTLSPIKGILEIVSDPLGAEVYINGTLIGTTPIKEYQVVPGVYEVKVVKEGYLEYGTTITIKPGETKSIVVALTKLEETQTTTKVTESTCGPATIILALFLPLVIKRKQ